MKRMTDRRRDEIAVDVLLAACLLAAIVLVTVVLGIKFVSTIVGVILLCWAAPKLVQRAWNHYADD